MIQKTYRFYNHTELQSVIDAIRSEPSYETASGILLQLYNPRLDVEEELLIEALSDAFPSACLTGITAANIAKKKFDISDSPLLLSVTFFQNTRLIQFDFSMDTITAFVAGRIMNEFMEKMENLKCLQIFYASNNDSINTFINEFRHHPIPIFGVKAGRNISRQNVAHVYGKKIYRNGFVIIAFESETLSLYMDNNLGWQPIGIEMVISKTNGENIISEIDKKPATEIYEKYLKVSPNPYFFENVCEFPLIIERNGLQVARVPAAYDETGAIYLTSDVYTGEHFRLSYATPDQLFALTQKSAEDLKQFSPEAVYLFECGNRLRFLGESYLKEIEQYHEVFDQLSTVTGYAELFVVSEELGADLNSSLVVVGLKESEPAKNVIVPNRKPVAFDYSCNTPDREIPFMQRIMAFLESTSKELDALNKELGKIAFTDRLTKIYNRWELERKIDEYLELNRHGKTYGLLFLDIDHFKAINDNYGHDEGDRALKAVVAIVKDFLQNDHAFGRWGGEEFIYLYPADSPEELFHFAETIRKAIDEVCFINIKHITISVGASMARTEDTMLSFVKRADSALYQAKETGRNKVVLL